MTIDTRGWGLEKFTASIEGGGVPHRDPPCDAASAAFSSAASIEGGGVPHRDPPLPHSPPHLPPASIEGGGVPHRDVAIDYNDSRG